MHRIIGSGDKRRYHDVERPDRCRVVSQPQHGQRIARRVTRSRTMVNTTVAFSIGENASAVSLLAAGGVRRYQSANHTARTTNPPIVLRCCSRRATLMEWNSGGCTIVRSRVHWLVVQECACVNWSHARCVATPTTTHTTINPNCRQPRNDKGSSLSFSRRCSALGNNSIAGPFTTRSNIHSTNSAKGMV